MIARPTRDAPDLDADDSDIAELDPDEALLADLPEEAEPAPGSVAMGRAAIARAIKHAPNGPGVYRMVGEGGAVLYVGKAKSIKRRIVAYTRPTGLTARIMRMVAATMEMEFVSTGTETEALLLEANLIKQLRPRFNVLLRDDKSFPYILITRDHVSPQITKHRGARNRPGDYYGPFASVWAVNRTINALQKAFLVRSCSDSFYEARTRPCLLFQIKRCAGPCTGEVSHTDYAEYVREARDFLSGRSKAVKEQLAREMEIAAQELEFERAAALRDRLAALSAVQGTQGINPRSVEEADVFAIHQEGGATCVQVFFFRTGQNWGNHALYPRADRTLGIGEVLESFLAQFYEDKPCPRLVLISHDIAERELLEEALSTRAGHRVEVAAPRRGEKRELVEHALQNAREALGRKLAESASQARLLEELARAFDLKAPPARIEVYDNSHIMGSNAVGGMIVAGPEGFAKSQYRKFNIRSTELTPGDDYGMMREVLTRRFARLLKENPRALSPLPEGETAPDVANVLPPTDPPGVPSLPGGEREGAEDEGSDREASATSSAWPDLLLIDGGPGQLKAARETLAGLGVTDVPMVGVAKGPDRDAGRETFYIDGREPFRLEPRDPVLYFVQRLRDEAHRFAIGSHRARRKKDITQSGLQEIPGIGPTRKRALLHHFGTLKAIERASLADLEGVPGVNAATARAVYDFFHAKPT
ncbi:excinuclease ABC subunit UvrC [Ancylobacter dichloromethanicus]|uniref:UvrABC system protein C n=1 Tax=Ancylobacter dichloromethanicus TaxID=518825 RepID=A0A9W6J6W2_9HYPH|nr:excinuclease ABC subunit UvrC [Ancylobacter dichloromethanicus]MBS7553790.1 excinuclease ABC subunit UvrC [Ancylobacter dichloromethanicus]GLK70896.1 UvrABC system protein C [Ancylobacter dichloromethanicus]